MIKATAIPPDERQAPSVEVPCDRNSKRYSQPLLGDWVSPAKAAFKRCVLPLCGVTCQLAERRGLLLTFDDGPDPEVTPAVLDQLARYGARAVFFIVGNRIQRAPYLLRRIVDEGHLIGNHTFRHPLDRIPGLVDYYRDVRECQSILESYTGRRPTLFRPPLGSLTVSSLLAPRFAGLRTLLWSVDVDDWTLRRNDDATRAGHQLAEVTRPGDIVLLHDDNPCVVTLLKTALPRLCERRLNLGDAWRQL
jgi:peptidoglycan/xylan/chitin deacetylase (PgdA/CDA1 family)